MSKNWVLKKYFRVQFYHPKQKWNEINVKELNNWKNKIYYVVWYIIFCVFAHIVNIVTKENIQKFILTLFYLFWYLFHEWYFFFIFKSSLFCKRIDQKKYRIVFFSFNSRKYCFKRKFILERTIPISTSREIKYFMKKKQKFKHTLGWFPKCL